MEDEAVGLHIELRHNGFKVRLLFRRNGIHQDGLLDGAAILYLPTELAASHQSDFVLISHLMMLLLVVLLLLVAVLLLLLA